VLELAVKHAGLAVAMELLMRLVFSYAVGNDDHHLKNISFLYHPAFKLTPCYDILASALYSGKSENPMALRFLSSGQPSYYETMGNGFYAGCDFIELGMKAGLLGTACTKRIENLVKKIEIEALQIITNSFMDPERQEDYLDLLNTRLQFLKHLEKPDAQ
jgi:serine/threonine-protein kinase HipA